MKNRSFIARLGLILLLLAAGCAPKKPADTSDPKASVNWLNYALEKAAEKSPGIRSLRGIYEHAAELEKAYPQDPDVTAFLQENRGKLARIPEQVFRLSIPAGDLEAFKWGLAENPEIKTRFDELLAIWKRGTQWQETAMKHFPEALPVFMSQAVDSRFVNFFNQYAEAFKATGYALASPLQKSEFMPRYLTLIGIEAEKAVKAKDTERIVFLIDHTPGFEYADQTLLSTRKQLQELGSYVLYEISDEKLTARLLQLGFEFENLDLSKIDIKSSFAKSLKENPENAVRMVGLDKPGKPLNKAAARFLLQLPVSKLTNLHPQHVDEAIEMCLKAGGGDIAKKFIQLKAAQKPLDRNDYIKLMTLGLKYNNNTIYGMAIKHGGDISVFDLDIAELAYNQRIFEKQAPKFMANIYNTMDDKPMADGITLGTIFRIFQCENEKAGLWIVKKYDLEENWSEANGDQTLLMDVCRADNLEAARYLIEKRKADLHATTRYSRSETSLFGQARPKEGKLSAIFFAAQSGNSDLIRYLKKMGANINARSNYGATPLMYAVSAGQLDAVKTLIELGASVRAEMNAANRNDIFEDGKNYTQLSTALNRARAYGFTEIAAILEQAGAK